MIEQMLNRVELGSVRGRREAHEDRVFGDCHLPRRSEQVRDQLLCFARSTHVRRDDCGEFGLGIRAHDADHVDDRLEVARVPDEFAGEVGLLDGSMLRDLRSQRFEVTLPLERLGELAFDLIATYIVRRQARELAACVAFGGAPDLECAFDLAACRVRNDRARRVRLDAPAVEMIDAPTLVAVLEAVLLIMPTSA